MIIFTKEIYLIEKYFFACIYVLDKLAITLKTQD